MEFHKTSAEIAKIQSLLKTKLEEQRKQLSQIQGKLNLSPQMFFLALDLMNKYLIEFNTTQWANLMQVSKACREQIKKRTDEEWCDIVFLTKKKVWNGEETDTSHKKRRIIDWKGNTFKGCIVDNKEWNQSFDQTNCDSNPLHAAWNSKVQKLLQPGEIHDSNKTQEINIENRPSTILWPFIIKV